MDLMRRADGGRRVRKTSELIARDLVNQIIDEGLEPGHRLPNEREMLEALGVGRATLREALRLLETRGVMTIRSGPGGGPVVRRPRADDLGDALTLILQFEQASLADIWEARQALEPTIVRLAAERIDPEQLDELSTALDSMKENIEDQELYLRDVAVFHGIIAQASGSSVLEILNAALRSVADGASLGVEYQRRHRIAGMESLRHVLDALQARDPDGTQRAMLQHLEEAQAYWKRRFPDLYQRSVRWKH